MNAHAAVQSSESAAVEQKEGEEGNENQRNSLFIGNLSRYCKEIELLEAFKDYQIIDANIKVMKGNRMPLGYGFLRFPSNELAERCREECDGKVVNGRQVKLSPAYRNTRLIISNVDLSLTRERICDMFRKYGLIDENAIRIYPGDINSTVLIEFAERSSAERAKKDINSKRSEPPYIRADWQTGSYSCQDSNTDDDIVSVYIRYESKIPDQVIDEVYIARAFSKFGKVKDVSIKKSFNSQIGSHIGYGFVHFENNADGKIAAVRAIQSMQWVCAEDVLYCAEASKNLLRIIGEGNEDPSTMIPLLDIGRGDLFAANSTEDSGSFISPTNRLGQRSLSIESTDNLQQGKTQVPSPSAYPPSSFKVQHSRVDDVSPRSSTARKSSNSFSALAAPDFIPPHRSRHPSSGSPSPHVVGAPNRYTTAPAAYHPVPHHARSHVHDNVPPGPARSGSGRSQLFDQLHNRPDFDMNQMQHDELLPNRYATSPASFYPSTGRCLRAHNNPRGAGFNDNQSSFLEYDYSVNTHFPRSAQSSPKHNEFVVKQQSHQLQQQAHRIGFLGNLDRDFGLTPNAVPTRLSAQYFNQLQTGRPVHLQRERLHHYDSAPTSSVSIDRHQQQQGPGGSFFESKRPSPRSTVSMPSNMMYNQQNYPDADDPQTPRIPRYGSIFADPGALERSRAAGVGLQSFEGLPQVPFDPEQHGYSPNRAAGTGYSARYTGGTGAMGLPSPPGLVVDSNDFPSRSMSFTRPPSMVSLAAFHEAEGASQRNDFGHYMRSEQYDDEQLLGDGRRQFTRQSGLLDESL